MAPCPLIGSHQPALWHLDAARGPSTPLLDHLVGAGEYRGTLLRNPITGIAGCCDRTASGHAAAAPPMSVMKARRFTRSPRQRAAAETKALRCRLPSRSSD